MRKLSVAIATVWNSAGGIVYGSGADVAWSGERPSSYAELHAN
jgi:hypothetical protein